MRNHQMPNTERQEGGETLDSRLAAGVVWSLGFGACLMFGVWCLEF